MIRIYCCGVVTRLPESVVDLAIYRAEDVVARVGLYLRPAINIQILSMKIHSFN